jgi:hypothetical protein
MSKKQITEEDKVHEKWYEEARDMTPDKLPEFIRKLTEDYSHDYGTICHAVAAAAIGAAWSVDHSPAGGITGFQAGCIMWSFIQKWMSKDGPMRLVDYSNMLYPQYNHAFEKKINKDTWEWLQKEAKKNLKASPQAHENVVEHWQSIADGYVPFGYVVIDD